MNSRISLRVAAILALAPAVTGQTAPTTTAAVTAPEWGRHRIVWFCSDENPVKTQLSVGGERCAYDKATFATWKKGSPGDVLSLGDRGAMLDTFSKLRFDGGELEPGSYMMSLRRAAKGYELLFFDAQVLLRGGVTADRPGDEKPAARAPLKKAKGGRNKSPLTWYLSSKKPREPELRLTYGKMGLSVRFAIDGLKGTSPMGHEDPRVASRWHLGGDDFARIDYGAPAWNTQVKSELKEMTPGDGWRLGRNWWTTLVNSRQIKLGSKKIPPGVWRLTVAMLGKDKYSLQVHKATSITADRIDPAFLGWARVAARIPMTYSKSEPNKQLEIAFVPAGDDVNLTIHYGKHRLTVPVSK